VEYRFLDANTRLDSGEKEALKLCKQLNAEYFIADDKEARRVSRILSVKPIDACGVILQAYRRGLIAGREALKILDDLVKDRFKIEPTVHRQSIR